MSNQLNNQSLTNEEVLTLKEILHTLKQYGIVHTQYLTNREGLESLNQKLTQANPQKRKYTPNTHLCLAVDMDSTIWTEDYPHLGTPYPLAIETLNDLVKAGYQVNIWTSRGGDNLEKCKHALYHTHKLDPRIEFNQHFKHYTDQYPVASPKIAAHVYFDDKAYNAPDYSNYWSVIRQEFLGE